MADRSDRDRTDPGAPLGVREPDPGGGSAAVATESRRPSRRRAPSSPRRSAGPETATSADTAASPAADPQHLETSAPPEHLVEPLVEGSDAGTAPAPGAVSLVVGGRMPRRQRRRLEQAARLRARQADGRYRLAYDVAGPKVRLGVLWAALLAGSLAYGGVAVAMLFAPVAGVAALQGAQAWRAAGARPRPVRPLAGALGALLPLAAIGGPGGLGTAILFSVAGCIAVAMLLDRQGRVRPDRPTPRPLRPPVVIGVASATLRSGFFVGLAAGCVVVARQLDTGAAVAMVVLVCAYEVGDYLVGSGSTTMAEGPAAGCIGVFVATFALSVVRPDPFASAGSVWAMGVVTALACPLGQLGASLLLPSGGAFAPALRRLDSYLVVAPIWAMVLLMGALG